MLLFFQGGGGIVVWDIFCFCEVCFDNGNLVLVCEVQVIYSISFDFGQGIKRGIIIISFIDELVLEYIVNDMENVGELYQVDVYVVVIFESKWYIGKIFEYEKENQEYYVIFMIGGKKLFRWFEKIDKIWIFDSYIF